MPLRNWIVWRAFVSHSRVCILYHALPHSYIHANFHRNQLMLAESSANTNQPACESSLQIFIKMFFCSRDHEKQIVQNNSKWPPADILYVPLILFSIFIVMFRNIHIKFQINLSMFVESRANTNVHHFHAQTASWRPF